jgi:hypothetical protein
MPSIELFAILTDSGWRRPAAPWDPTPVREVAENWPRAGRMRGGEVFSASRPESDPERPQFATPTCRMFYVGDCERARYSWKDRPDYEAVNSMWGDERGLVNPDWFEWLMGWPIGWTDASRAVDLEAWLDGMILGTWWDDEPVPRTGDCDDRLSRIHGIGNGQVALCAAHAFLTLLDEAMAEDTTDEIDVEEFLGI